jgi:undecaprenyl-diphosphatase
MATIRVALRRLRIMPRWVRKMDARAAASINRRHAHPAIDRGILGLSHGADRGVLWFAAASLLVMFGGRFRRAGLRGAASLAVASVLANLVGKTVFGGDRPLLGGVPISRRLVAQPTSASFPSGHSASAAGFVVGVAIESPMAGGALAPLAGAVAYSRLHTGAHWLSDVLGGLALGAAVAAVGRILVPARRSRPAGVAPLGATPRAAAPSAGTDELPALPDGAGAFILINPLSGVRLVRENPARIIERRLPAARVRQLLEGEVLSLAVREALESDDPPRVLGIHGGDGSVAAAAQLARRAGIPLLVFPGGTFNHFAGTAGIESVDAAIDALQTGRGGRVDVAELSYRGSDPITVLNTASVGIYPRFVAEREKLERRIGKRLASVVAAVTVLANANPIDVTVDGRRLRVWSIFVGVNRYFSAVAAPLQRRRLDDGVLDVRILRAGLSRSRMRGMLALAFGRKTSMVDEFTAERLRVSVRSRHGDDPGFAHDGEAFLTVQESSASLRQSGEKRAGGGHESELWIVPGGLLVYGPTAR